MQSCEKCSFGKKELKEISLVQQAFITNTQKTAIQVILLSRISCLILKNIGNLNMCHLNTKI